MLRIKNLTKDYMGKKIGPFNLEINPGTIVSIIGRSGAGKSTLIKLISQMEEKSNGSIFYEEKELVKSDFTYISQSGTLFDHLTVKDNLELTVKLDDNISEILSALNLDKSYLDKYPFELSGGERQRIDLMRPLIAKTKLILLDEAFSALDMQTKDEIHELINFLNREYKITFLVITHDIQEALILGEQVLVIDDGEQVYFGNRDKILSGDVKRIDNLINKDKMQLLRRIFNE